MWAFGGSVLKVVTLALDLIVTSQGHLMSIRFDTAKSLHSVPEKPPKRGTQRKTHVRERRTRVRRCGP